VLRNDEDARWLQEMFLLTEKPILYVANIAEEDLPDGNAHVDAVRAVAELQGAGVVVISAEFEAQLAQLPGVAAVAPDVERELETEEASPTEEESGAEEETADSQGEIFITGTGTVSNAGIVSNSFDLDTNDEQMGEGDSEVDLVGGGDGLGTANGAVISARLGGRPSLNTCASIATQDWETRMNIEDFELTSFYCVRSSEGRYGYLETTGRGGTWNMHFSYVLWEHVGDQ
jgi:hypothetical protein